ncbi:hypothetical protein MLD38_032036 [Melastoma candidum]|uniref:Uncharacterized protein n=1 Tax=Melastoma candidum TaxID=119954 RepID=A0ACB9MQY2_9MYRT|nr:hypothetical protein MLD38_032036 [Melastoma candidum]
MDTLGLKAGMETGWDPWVSRVELVRMRSRTGQDCMGGDQETLKDVAVTKSEVPRREGVRRRERNQPSDRDCGVDKEGILEIG